MPSYSAVLRFAFAGLLCLQVSAQSSANSPSPQANLTAEQLVDQLVENAQVYRSTLPSLAAHETIVSKDSGVLLIGKSTVHAEATMRVMRKMPEGKLEELREFTAVNGKPPVKGKPADLPFSIGGGFGHFPAGYFDREKVSCFSFVLSPRLQPEVPLELSIRPGPQTATLPQCKGIAMDLAAIARIDPTTHQLVRLEEKYVGTEAPKDRLIFLAVDLAPTKIGQNSFWLPTTLSGKAVLGKTRAEWVSHYSDFHQFASTSNIRPTS